MCGEDIFVSIEWRRWIGGDKGDDFAIHIHLSFL